MRKNRYIFLTFAILGFALSVQGSPILYAGSGSSHGISTGDPSSFMFGVIGDVPYSSSEEEQFPRLIQDLNHKPLAFTVHVGDFKSGGSLCRDMLYSQRLKEFQASQHPFILIPGDNDWTDCHRNSNGGFDPEERLGRLRKVFFSTSKSLGQHTLPLLRQSHTPKFSEYVENIRWNRGPVLLVGLHVVGSNNNLGRTPKADLEYQRRHAANLAWMKESFQTAREMNYRGIVLFIHGNPFEPDPEVPESSGFRDFLENLEGEVRQWKRPVALIHGDTHHFRIDKPLPLSKDEPRLMSFTRVESFGSPNVQWVQVFVDLNNPDLFSFAPVTFSK